MESILFVQMFIEGQYRVAKLVAGALHLTSLEMALSENEWYSENVTNYASEKSLEETLEIFTISEELLEEIVCKVMAPINEIGICVNVKRKRKLNEGLDAQSIESPAKRRAQVQIICDEAPKVQNICDEAPEVQKKTVKT